MIRVVLAPEPHDFDRKVRQMGNSAMREQIGLPKSVSRPGPPIRKIADRIEDIPTDQLKPYWQDCLDDLHAAYRGICAYVAVYIEPVTGSRSVDHFVAKSLDRSLAYEWSNYRLACGRMNSRKNDVPDCLDPFEVGEGWFELELHAFQLRAGEGLPAEVAARVEQTIERLGLCDLDCCDIRRTYAEEYWNKHISLDYLERRSPFVARELRRQRRLNAEDLERIDTQSARPDKGCLPSLLRKVW